MWTLRSHFAASSHQHGESIRWDSGIHITAAAEPFTNRIIVTIASRVRETVRKPHSLWLPPSVAPLLPPLLLRLYMYMLYMIVHVHVHDMCMYVCE